MEHSLNILKEFKKIIETGNIKHVYKNELDKVCFANDAEYSDRKDLAKRTISDKILKNRVYEIAINPKNDGLQGRLASMFSNFFDKKTGSGAKSSVNEELAQELHKPVIKKYARLKDTIWAVDLNEMEHYLLKIKVLNICYV